MFTEKTESNDDRPSYHVYLYGEYEGPVDNEEVYGFLGNLSKNYNGEPVSFSLNKDVNILI